MINTYIVKYTIGPRLKGFNAYLYIIRSFTILLSIYYTQDAHNIENCKCKRNFYLKIKRKIKHFLIDM